LEAEFVCFETGSVQEFFELALREQPDVILADLEMLPLSGLKLCRMVKANPALAAIPFVLLTAHETAEDKITSLADGADDHLPKSITPRELLGRIRATVRLRNAMLHAANLRGLVEQRTQELSATTQRLHAEVARREHVEAELRLAQKLEAVGQLAAGVAHEINTPIQFIGDAIAFLREACADVLTALDASQSAALEATGDRAEVSRELERINASCDLAYIRQEVPRAFAMTADGVQRVTTVVSAMKALVQPGQSEAAPIDLRAALENALIVTRTTYQEFADVETDFADLPPVEGHVGELSQVFLALIVNAAHAVAEMVGNTGARGTIGVRTRSTGHWVTVSVTDNGPGIPESIRDRIFEPFFTTKAEGEGSGQGLAIARAIVVDRHGGRLTFESGPGRGTTFNVELPLGTRPPEVSGA
jgi:signal transduction histidine kinase